MDILNIIFLDIDGVVNDAIAQQERGYITFEQHAMKYLKEIVHEADARIVISSNWRHFEWAIEAIKEELGKYGLVDKFIGCTPILVQEMDKTIRPIEIRQWLDQNKNIVKNFVIIDDNQYMGEFTYTNLAWCDHTKKINEDVKKKSLRILNVIL
jgi:sugar-specific transcriptional regulator TrmB